MAYVTIGTTYRFQEALNFMVSEDAVPLDIIEGTGGVPQMSATVEASATEAKSYEGSVSVLDERLGLATGKVISVSEINGHTTITGEGAATVFNIEVSAMPQRGTFHAAIEYYLSLAGADTYSLVIHPDVPNFNVNYPGFVGNLWEEIKKVLSIERFGITLIPNETTLGVYITPMRWLTVVEEDLITDNYLTQRNQESKTIEIAYYVMEPGNRIEVFPGSEGADAMELTANANEASTYRIELQGSVSQINTPQVVDWVDDEPSDGTLGMFAVTGSDGKPVTAKQWIGQGGALSVQLIDSSTIEVTVVGPDNKHLSPYSLTMSSGNSYGALRITGNGMRWVRKTILYHTGSEILTHSEEPGTVFDSPAVSDISEAAALTKAAQVANTVLAKYAGVQHFVSGSFITSPLFGAVAGSRFYHNDAYFRILTADTTPAETTFTAVGDTIVRDFDNKFGNMTVADFDAIWADKSMRQQVLEPLRDEV